MCGGNFEEDDLIKFSRVYGRIDPVDLSPWNHGEQRQCAAVEIYGSIFAEGLRSFRRGLVFSSPTKRAQGAERDAVAAADEACIGIPGR